MKNILEDIKSLISEKVSDLLEKLKERKEQRELAMAIQKAEEEERKRELARLHLLELKRYFSGCFLDFYVTTQGDVYEIFPHNRYRSDNFIPGKKLDVRTKVRMPEKSQQDKIAKKLLADFKDCEETFWKWFAKNSNAIEEEIRHLTLELERVYAQDEEARLRGTLSVSKHVENQNLFYDLRENRDDLEEELKKRWQIWNAHFAISELEFLDDFLEFQVRPKR